MERIRCRTWWAVVPARRLARMRLASGGLALCLSLVLGLAAASAAPRAEVLPLTGNDLRQNQAQRELADRLARRHVGPPLRRTEADLRVIQQLVDRKHVDADDRFELQALGVALGDVMVEQLGVAWVILIDDWGRSRALRYGETDAFFFPVTMISRRVETGLRADVRELYAEVAERVRALDAEAERRRSRRRTPITIPPATR